MISDRALIAALLRHARRQERLIQDLRQAFGTVALTLVERDPRLVAEFSSRLEEFQRLEREELPDDIETRETWAEWLKLREDEIITGKTVTLH